MDRKKYKKIQDAIDVLQELQQHKCGKKVVKFSESAVCSICHKSFGWWCPNSIDHKCDYSGEMGEDACVMCGDPEERA